MIDPIALSQALIRVSSVTPAHGEVFDVLRAALEPLGFVCHRLVFGEDEGTPTENLYAKLGDEGPNLCFLGHLDVVPAGDEAAWTHPPFGAEIHDGVLYGRGAEDMKGAVACFVAAVAELLKKNPVLPGSVSLLLAGDEEGVALHGTKKVIGWLREKEEVVDVCIVGEPTNPNVLGEMAKIGRRGSMNATLTIHGKQGHVAYPQLAMNPITVLVNILHEIKHTALDEGTEFFQPSNIEITSIDVGNPAVNVIPAHAAAKFNIRFNPAHSSRSLEEWLSKLCAKHAGHDVHYDLAIRVSGEAFLSTPAEWSSTVAQAIEEVTGTSPELSTTGGTSDARFMKDVCPLVEFGTTGKTIHMVNECIPVKDLELLTKIYMRVIGNYFNLPA